METSGVCKISDFGTSKRMAYKDKNRIHEAVSWMAPEVGVATRKGVQHIYDGKFDIWSLGCVVLEMWAGGELWQDIDVIVLFDEVRFS